MIQVVEAEVVEAEQVVEKSASGEEEIAADGLAEEAEEVEEAVVPQLDLA